MPIHLRPSAPTAPDAILCGDPSRALAIAQAVLPQPRMSNHHRGLWGYWGETAEGCQLTVQATGIGGPSAVTVLGELTELGLRRAIRVGTCAIPGAEYPPGSPLVVTGAIAEDGCSAALGIPAGTVVTPDPTLTGALTELTGAPGATIVSRDLQPIRSDITGDSGDEGGSGELGESEGLPADLQTAAILAFGSKEGLEIGAALAVASSTGQRLEDEPLEAALMMLAAAAVEALTRVPSL